MTEVRTHMHTLAGLLFGGLDVHITSARIEDGIIYFKVAGSDVPAEGILVVRKLHTLDHWLEPVA